MSATQPGDGGPGRRIQWAPRLRPRLLERLYDCDARGIHDDELLDDVGITFLARCEDIRRVSERRCWVCGGGLAGERTRGSTLRCEGCGWSVGWTEYQRSYRSRRVWGARALPAVNAFLREYPCARGWAEKMAAIDRLVHSVHESLEKDGNPWVAPLAENLIEGSAQETFRLLELLANGQQSTAGLRECRAAWCTRLEDYRRHLAGRTQRRATPGGQRTRSAAAGDA